jgi:hypothetical protein
VSLKLKIIVGFFKVYSFVINWRFSYACVEIELNWRIKRFCSYEFIIVWLVFCRLLGLMLWIKHGW